MKYCWNYIVIVLIHNLSFSKPYDGEAGDFDDIDRIPIVRNKYNPNFLEIEISINSKSYSVPLDLTESQILIPSPQNEKIQQASYSSSSFIQKKGLVSKNVLGSLNYSVSNCKNCPSSVLYHEGINYASGSAMSWFPLAKSNLSSSTFRPISSFDFSISLTNNTHGYLNLGDHRNFKQRMDVSSIFFCPQIQDGHLWGSTIKAIVSGFIQDHIDKNDGMDAIDILESMNPYHVNESFYFDLTQRFFLVPFHFFLFLQNYSMKKFIEAGQCRISIDADNTYMFICQKEVKRHLPDLNIIVLHWLMVFDGRELVEEIPDSNEVVYKIISQRMQSRWVVGQFFFRKYSVIFEEHDNNLHIFSYDRYVKAVAVYSYQNKKLSKDDYDLRDYSVKDHRFAVAFNAVLSFVCIAGLMLLIFVKVGIIPNIKR